MIQKCFHHSKYIYVLYVHGWMDGVFSDSEKHLIRNNSKTKGQCNGAGMDNREVFRKWGIISGMAVGKLGLRKQHS